MCLCNTTKYSVILHTELQSLKQNIKQVFDSLNIHTVYPKKYAHGFCFAVLCCGYTLIDFPISIKLTALALWQSNDCPSASKATLMNMDKYFMWIHYERLHNHNKAKHNKTVCIFLGIYCTSPSRLTYDVYVEGLGRWHPPPHPTTPPHPFPTDITLANKPHEFTTSWQYDQCIEKR